MIHKAAARINELRAKHKNDPSRSIHGHLDALQRLVGHIEAKCRQCDVPVTFSAVVKGEKLKVIASCHGAQQELVVGWHWDAGRIWGDVRRPWF